MRMLTVGLVLGICAALHVGTFLPADRSPVADIVLTEPDAGVRPVLRLIDAAQNSVFVETYILTDVRINRALERAEAQGVDVRVILDPRALGMGTQPEREARLLRAAGIDVRWAPARFPLTHAKFMVFDDRVALLSTANFSRSGFGTNREFLIVDRDRAETYALSNLFRHDWDRLPFATSTGRLVLSPHRTRTVLDRVLSASRRGLDVYAEELQDPSISARFERLVKMGRRVRILLASGTATSLQRALTRAGVHICQPRAPYIHAKSVIADGQLAYVGSGNLSAQSLDRNREVGLLVRGPDVRVLETRFTRDWLGSRCSG